MDIYEDIRRNLLAGHAKEVKSLVEKALALKYPPESILQDGLILGGGKCFPTNLKPAPSRFPRPLRLPGP